MTIQARVFTDQFLLDAGKPGPELIARALQRGDFTDGQVQLNRLRDEIFAMYYNYRGWQKKMLEVFAARDGDDKPAQVIATIESVDAPERKIVTDGAMARWKGEIEIISKAIDDVGGGVDDAADMSVINQLVHSLHEHALSVHDGMMSRVNAMLSELYRDYGEQVLMETLQQVMNPAAIDPDGKLPFKEKVEQLIFFTRLHLLPFTVIEDDEKAIFMPDPCPSGARLIRAGNFEPPRNGALVKEAGPLTYGQKDFPVYCCHEPAMEISSIKQTGVPVFIVDQSDQLGIKPCKVYVYKDNNNIPARFYERLGLKKPEDLIAHSQ